MSEDYHEDCLSYAELAVKCADKDKRIAALEAEQDDLRKEQRKLRAALTGAYESRARYRAELAEAREQAHAEAKAGKLHLHQVLTCGIIAEGKEHLNPIYQAGGKWDTLQAGMVRNLRAENKRMRERIARWDRLQERLAKTVDIDIPETNDHD